MFFWVFYLLHKLIRPAHLKWKERHFINVNFYLIFLGLVREILVGKKRFWGKVQLFCFLTLILKHSSLFHYSLLKCGRIEKSLNIELMAKPKFCLSSLELKGLSKCMQGNQITDNNSVILTQFHTNVTSNKLFRIISNTNHLEIGALI